MNDDELLANILRKFISDPDDAYGGYWWTGQYRPDGPSFMTLDKSVELTDDEMNAVRRFCS